MSTGERLTSIHRCPVCGKRFEVVFADLWVYREKRCDGRLICTWRCMRESEKKLPGKRGRQRACAARDAELLRLYLQGAAVEDLAAKNGISISAVRCGIENAMYEQSEREEEA